LQGRAAEISMETAIQTSAAITFVVIGLSHVLRPRAWATLFVRLHGLGEAGSLLVALLHLPVGALIVAFHNVWQGVPAVLTLLGHLWILKSLVYLSFPRWGLQALSKVSPERPAGFIVGGTLLVAVGCLIALG
jgi:uncharacterized protein YjeT (DUF2065 family)